jgi:cytochrome c biogenesis protein CcmG, thiol:disulfide interchange protein DsbE
MRKVLLIALLAAGFVSTTPAAEVVDFAALKGKVVYLDFWASWCVPCRQSFPWMTELQRKLEKDGLVIVAVNLDQERADAEHFLSEFMPSFRVAFDPKGALAERYHVNGMPTSVLIGRDGKALTVHQGFRSKDRDALEQQIRSVLK